MRHFLLIPVVLSALALGAHFLRGGQVALALTAAALPLLLVLHQIATLRLLQALLLLGAIEWLRSLDRILDLRLTAGQPWHRLVAILSAVAVFTGLSALAAGRWFRARERRRDAMGTAAA